MYNESVLLTVMCSCPSPYQLMTFSRHSIIPQDTRASTPTDRANRCEPPLKSTKSRHQRLNAEKALTILVAGQVIQEGKQGSGIFLWERCQQRICPKVNNFHFVSIKLKTFFFKLMMLHKLVNSVLYQKRLKWFTCHVLDTRTYEHRKKPVIGRGSSCINYVIQPKHKEISS